MIRLCILVFCGCTSAPAPVAPRAAPADTADESPPAPPRDTAPPLVTEETIEAWESPVYSDTEVMQIEITLSDAAVAALRTSPTTYVEGSVTANGHTWSPVGVRLKGSASFRGIDDKSNWKIKFQDYTDERFYGLDRLTLQNNIWDPSMMAQDLAYRFFAAAGVPSPQTGYAWITLNGADKGLYTILESMDGQFVDRVYPDTEGNLYEMTRSCDFLGDGSCYELQVTGDGEPDPDHALATATAAARSGDLETIRAAFDWPRLLAFLAVERVINHPDSYSYNLNNYFVYHNPTDDTVSLIPWGADSTFVYTYPPDIDDYDCAASAYLDVLAAWPVGYLGAFCQSDPTCWAELSDAMVETADLLLTVDLAGYAEQNRARIRDYVAADPYVSYTIDHFDARVDCFEQWMTARPAEIAARLGR